MISGFISTSANRSIFTVSMCDAIRLKFKVVDSGGRLGWELRRFCYDLSEKKQKEMCGRK